MSNVELSDEDVVFLTTLANELTSQNRYGTAKPVFMQVREIGKQFGIDPDYSDDTVLLIGDDYDECYTVEQAKELLSETYEYTPDDLEHCDSLQELENFCDEQGITASYTGYREVEQFHECFLTRSGYEQHMTRNSHNYRGQVSVYVKHAFRNPELERLLSIVEKFATVADGDN